LTRQYFVKQKHSGIFIDVTTALEVGKTGRFFGKICFNFHAGVINVHIFYLGFLVTMKLAVAASLVASAAAFAPASVSKSSTALKAYENEVGVIEPTGYFDPLGLVANADQATFDQYRAAEL
jgi:hypothetical protein